MKLCDRQTMQRLFTAAAVATILTAATSLAHPPAKAGWLPLGASDGLASSGSGSGGSGGGGGGSGNSGSGGGGNSGSGSGGSGGGGGNSGPGGGGDDDDNSGPGGGDDDDNSGHNGSGGGGAHHINQSGARIEVDGDNIEIIYPDGWKEELEGGRYELKDPWGRTVIERRATADDIARLQAIAF